MEIGGAEAVAIGAEQFDGLQPDGEREAGILKQRSDGDGELFLADPAGPQAGAAGADAAAGVRGLAVRAHDVAIGPAKGFQKLAGLVFGRVRRVHQRQYEPAVAVCKEHNTIFKYMILQTHTV